MFIGDKMFALRRQKRMTLSELSKISGIQLATLSRIENKKMVGTLESHIGIAKALEIDITELYKGIDKDNSPIEVGGSNATDVFTHSEDSSYEILTKNILHKKMMPTLIRIDEGGRTNKEQNKNGTEKFIFALEGRVEVTVNDQIFNLHKHNTLYFDASLPHFYRNTGKATARLLSIMTPVSL